MRHSESAVRRPRLVEALILTFAATITTGAARGQQIEWLSQFGDPNPMATTWVADVKLVGGFVYVAGTASSPSATDGFVRKLDGAGNLVWEQTFGTTGYDEVTVLHVAGSDVFVAGITNGEFAGQTDLTPFTPDVFVLRYDTNGAAVSTIQIPRLSPAPYGTPYPGFVDSSGVVGSDLVEAQGAFDSDVQVFKYDLAGNLLWSTEFGSWGDDQVGTAWPRSLSVDASGICVTGSVQGALPGESLVGFIDAFLARLDPDGNVVWLRQIGAAESASSGCGVVSDSTAIYLSGMSAFQAESADLFVSRYDLAGNLVWTRELGTPGNDAFYSGLAANENGVCVAGATDGALPGFPNAGAYDVFARMYDPSGTEVWTLQLGSTGTDAPYAVGLNGADAFVAGTAQSQLPNQSAPAGAFVFEVSTAVVADSDGDGLSDADEIARGTNPQNPDTDGDALLDGAEVVLAGGGSCPSPLDADSDDDDLSDGVEVDVRGTSPCLADTDADGLPDSLDPYPLVPGTSRRIIAIILHRFAEMTEELPLPLFAGSSQNARRAARHEIAARFHVAACLEYFGFIHASRVMLTTVLNRIDGAPSPSDWMVASPQKADMAAAITLLLSLMGGGGCGG